MSIYSAMLFRSPGCGSEKESRRVMMSHRPARMLFGICAIAVAGACSGDDDTTGGGADSGSVPPDRSAGTSGGNVSRDASNDGRAADDSSNSGGNVPRDGSNEGRVADDSSSSGGDASRDASNEVRVADDSSSSGGDGSRDASNEVRADSASYPVVPGDPPFTTPLPIPAVLAPTAGPSADAYNMTIRAGTAQMRAGAPTPIVGFNGVAPGPTIVATRGRAVQVTQTNGWTENVTIHNHGHKVAATSDGHPVDYIAPGGSKVYSYPNDQRAGPMVIGHFLSRASGSVKAAR